VIGLAAQVVRAGASVTDAQGQAYARAY